jgi:hypothetical protein
MNNEFKKILLSIAKLPRSDQQWLLKQLTTKQREQFTTLNGHSLLNNALKFRKLPVPERLHEMHLPKVCNQLGLEDPLYIAIILEQGQFSWESLFLQTCVHQQQINEQLQFQVKKLKPATKNYLFQHWQEQLAFSDQLEISHG